MVQPDRPRRAGAPVPDGIGADATVFLSGALDGESVAEARAVLKAADPAGRTVLDVSGLHFIDSSGLGLLLAHDDRMRRHGGVLVVRGPGATLRRVFEVTGVTGRLTIEA